jgi:hypothetical protein
VRPCGAIQDGDTHPARHHHHTRLGTLKFEGGYPDAATVEKVYDNLDFQRGVEVFLNSLQGASLVAMRRGLREVGAVDGTFGVFNTLMDAKSLFLTANTDTVYAFTWIDLSKGPVVLESPPNSLGIVDDFWFRYVADPGNAGPDKGKGGKYLWPRERPQSVHARFGGTSLS